MKKKLLIALAALAGLGAVFAFYVAPHLGSDYVPPDLAVRSVGQPAPDFTLPNSNGRQVSLADFRGRTVVLEWNNPECPFTQKHYDSGNMQRTQTAATGDGVVWLSINSSAPGNQGHMDAAEAREVVGESGARPTHYLLDPRGEVGRLYGASTTPHMYVINGEGTLVYAGAIDDRPTADTADIEGARNHVLAALADLRAGRAVSVPTSRPYGCNVKYANI
jgi:AhpC/TSA family